MALSLFLLAYAAGLANAPYLELTRSLTILPWLAALLWFVLRRRRCGSLFLAIFFWSIGVVLYHLSITPPQSPGHIRSYLGEQPRTIEATVLAISARPADRTQVDLEAHYIGTDSILAPARGKIRLFIDETVPDLNPGNIVRFRSRLRAPQTFGTPGEYNYPRHLARQEIFVLASLNRANELATLRAPQDRAAFFTIEGWRRELASGIENRLSPPTAALVKALVIGDKGGVTPQQRDLLARGGVSHIFAISGLHLGLIALFLYSTALMIYRRSETILLFAPPKRLLPLLIIPLLFAYLLLTGNALPTRRAFLMAMAGGVLLIGARRVRPLHLLASVAFVLLLCEPLALFEPSFQLSFAGVLGILLLLPLWQAQFNNWPKPIRWVALLFLTTVAATIATTPAVLLHFHMFAPAGLLTNLFAVPAIGFLAVPLGLAGGLLLPLWADGATLLLHGCGAVIETVLRLVEWFVDFPLLGGLEIHLSPVQSLGVAFLCIIPSVIGWAVKTWLLRALLAAVATLLLCWQPSVPAKLSITAFSVGQGDSFLVSLADGRNYLVDGGGLHGSNFDVGERLLAPALAHQGVRSLEAILLTHDQADHRQGLPYLLKSFRVRNFWCSEDPARLDPLLKETLRDQNVPVYQFPPGWSILEENNETTLALFVPAIETINPNDRSLVFYLRQGTDGLLLTGDLETPGVVDLLALPPPGPVNLLKLPHHGSRKSSPELLLEQFQPHLTFVSVGAKNAFRFPHAEVVTDLENRGIPLYRTDQSGSLRFISDGAGWRIQQWERGLFR